MPSNFLCVSYNFTNNTEAAHIATVKCELLQVDQIRAKMQTSTIWTRGRDTIQPSKPAPAKFHLQPPLGASLPARRSPKHSVEITTQITERGESKKVAKSIKYIF